MDVHDLCGVEETLCAVVYCSKLPCADIGHVFWDEATHDCFIRRSASERSFGEQSRQDRIDVDDGAGLVAGIDVSGNENIKGVRGVCRVAVDQWDFIEDQDASFGQNRVWRGSLLNPCFDFRFHFESLRRRFRRWGGGDVCRVAVQPGREWSFELNDHRKKFYGATGAEHVLGQFVCNCQ